MRVQDRIYGEHEITEPVLIELINSQPVQRLKSINQGGPIYFYNKNLTVSRYEHSIGVMILLRQLEANINEQIAGLLHDVAHTAFSHVVDHVYKDASHAYHDKHHQTIINNSEIPAILEKHDIDIKAVLDIHQYSLLEQDQPELCADRVDYALRDAECIRPGTAKHFINAFTTYKNRIIMTDEKKAEAFAEHFIRTDQELWAAPASAISHNLLAEAISIALNNKQLDTEELWEDDEYVLHKLTESQEPEITRRIKKLLDADLDHNTTQHVTSKVRYINPYVKTENGLKRATELSDTLLETIREHKKWHQRPIKQKMTVAPSITI